MVPLLLLRGACGLLFYIVSPFSRQIPPQLVARIDRPVLSRASDMALSGATRGVLTIRSRSLAAGLKQERTPDDLTQKLRMHDNASSKLTYKPWKLLADLDYSAHSTQIIADIAQPDGEQVGRGAVGPSALTAPASSLA